MSFDRWMHNFCFFRGIFAFFFGKFRIIFCTNFAIYFLINFRIFATFCISYFAKISHFFAKQKEAKFSHWYEKFLRNYFPFPLETLNITNKRMDNNSWHFIDKNVVLNIDLIYIFYLDIHCANLCIWIHYPRLITQDTQFLPGFEHTSFNLWQQNNWQASWTDCSLYSEHEKYWKSLK